MTETVASRITGRVIMGGLLIFFGLIGFVFWLSSLHDRPDFDRKWTGVPHGSGEAHVAVGTHGEHGRTT